MYYQNFYMLIFLTGCHFFLSGCGTTSIVTAEEAARTATAKQFIHNVGMGELSMAAFLKEKERQSVDQSGVAELANRALKNINQDDFEDLTAEVYARHLTHEDLLELAEFSEKLAIQRFCKIVLDSVLTSEPLNNQDLLRQFSADELTEIMKFSFSDSFARLKDVLPTINQEMAQAYRVLAQEMMRDYIKKQKEPAAKKPTKVEVFSKILPKNHPKPDSYSSCKELLFLLKENNIEPVSVTKTEVVVQPSKGINITQTYKFKNDDCLL